jgi:hypothetical protein
LEGVDRRNAAEHEAEKNIAIVSRMTAQQNKQDAKKIIKK